MAVGVVALILVSAQALVLPSTPSRCMLRCPHACAIAAAATPLLDAIEAAGVVGVDAEPEAQARCEEEAAALSATATNSIAAARVPLAGTYELLYSMAKGGSNGKVGPFIGKVSQIILDEKAFINQVELFGGFLTIQLHAEREILDDDRIRVSFVETCFSIYGAALPRQPTTGQGVWKQRYVEPGANGVAGFRVMDTPSLFVLKQKDEVDPAASLLLTRDERERYKRHLASFK
mmetsp:Transcript_54330/g.140319  ORF Transcript_54330/g.140319 Transcript_54330/m.140319 type:complete len:233 (-) Transcript_54330:435-1133(-)|eukprot:CAMPEP_0115856182 /NCGR_PEP_ID=MMETSP0287-20121206/14919_1 /TAXON_ID=412157 /ORGANISM="Chrysochromulina rotalis, Strain UIO044" /LENGTH=232 /DNA_ID=CAMNT_0003310345 /DNA_START=121 /DNA_END=819 /DNA_ORIENTATION=+